MDREVIEIMREQIRVNQSLADTVAKNTLATQQLNERLSNGPFSVLNRKMTRLQVTTLGLLVPLGAIAIRLLLG